MIRIIMLCMLTPIFSLANPTFPVKATTSTIKSVTVFVDGAQVTRTANITLLPGTTEFVFTKLSPHINESSIQISGLNDASILSINYAINHINKLDKSTMISQYENDIETLNDAIRLQSDIIKGYEEEIKVIEENRSLGNNNQIVDLDKLKQFTAYYRTRITELNKLIHAALKKNKTSKNRIDDIKMQLQELNVDDKIQTGEIKVKLTANSTKTLNLIIKYNVSNAGWFPVYDIKAKAIDKPLQLNYKAHVYQNTGISWNDVKLTLSTNDPNTNNTKPTVNSKYLNFVSSYSNYKTQDATKRYDYKFNPFVKTISGVITDESGLPLPGANVLIKGTNNGTLTDFDGHFTIKVVDGTALEVSYVGYTPTTIPIHSSIINVSLQEDISQLEEVVVAGYATKTKKSYTGAVSSVSAENITGSTGATSTIKIRGFGTLKSAGTPLYVIDGNISTERDFRQLDEASISKVDVLKDAAATSIYGSRGANGVILITTKGGTTTSNGDVILEGMATTSFEIKKLATIATDGAITVIDIEHYTLPASFSYFTAPVINENVFLTAKIGNWQHLNLLPGEANMYFEDSYAGVTHINPYHTKDSLTVSLGIDPNVVVARTPTNNFKKTNFTGSNSVIDKEYTMTLKNNKSTPIAIMVFDRIPVSQNKDIKVEEIDFGVLDYNDKTGILSQKFNVDSGDSYSCKFSYTVKYPRYRKVNL